MLLWSICTDVPAVQYLLCLSHVSSNTHKVIYLCRRYRAAELTAAAVRSLLSPLHEKTDKKKIIIIPRKTDYCRQQQLYILCRRVILNPTTTTIFSSFFFRTK